MSINIGKGTKTGWIPGAFLGVGTGILWEAAKTQLKGTNYIVGGWAATIAATEIIGFVADQFEDKKTK